MKFLDTPPPYLFFTGKGGVGKTSTACATAIRLASEGKSVLLVSTDPASNIGQVFGRAVGSQPSPLGDIDGLFAINIDPQEAAQSYRDRIVGPVRNVLPEDVVRNIEEQLSGACTTEIAAFDEFTGLLTDPKLTEDFDHIVFDTAPTGHTIRLLQLPGAWSEFIETNPDGSSCLGPLAGLEKQRKRYASAVAALTKADKTRVVLVARPQIATLREVARTATEFNALGISNQYLIINGVIPKPAEGQDRLADTVWRKQQDTLSALPAELTGMPTDQLHLKSMNMVGVDALKRLFEPEETQLADASIAHADSVDVPDFSAMVDTVAAQQHGLIMLMGKGGVGKTTLATAMAVQLAQKGLDVHLSTSDPAAHIEETLSGALPNLQVSRIDPVAETEKYRADVMAKKGAGLDAHGRALLEEDLKSPCTEEIAVFQAFSRIIREARNRIVVMDTAPTGHTLLLLDATGAYHKEMERNLGSGSNFVTPMMRLQDPDLTKVILVTLAETTPVLEAAGLQEDLRRAGIEPWGWVINNSLLKAQTRAPLLIQRARHELAEVNKVKNVLAKRLAIVPLQEGDPTGVEHLARLGAA